MATVEHHAGAFLITGRGYGHDGTLVQTDWDYPAYARDLGWNMRRVQPDAKGNARHLQRAPNRDHGCDHSGTDGTVNCPDCKLTATQFIAAAAEYLDSLC
jgi:hypothetical protein